MLESLEKFFERILQAFQDSAGWFETLLKRFLESCLAFIEVCYEWITNTIEAIIEYLSKLLPAVGKTIWMAFLLSLFYIPSFILVPWGISGGIAWMWITGGLWALAITAIGLGYRK